MRAFYYIGFVFQDLTWCFSGVVTYSFIANFNLGSGLIQKTFKPSDQTLNSANENVQTKPITSHKIPDTTELLIMYWIFIQKKKF